MAVYLIRHPQPRGAEGLCYGRTDLAVDLVSVERAAATVRTQIPDRVLRQAPIFTSPATRCVLLARALAAPREPVIADDLQEMNFGSWEGRPWSEVPRDELDAWARDPWGYTPGGLECAAMVARRWRRWARQCAGAARSGAVAVTHAGLIRVALASALGREPDARDLTAASVAFGTVHRIDLAAHEPCAAP